MIIGKDTGQLERHGNSTKEPNGNSKLEGKKKKQYVKSAISQIRLTAYCITEERMGGVEYSRGKKD